MLKEYHLDLLSSQDEEHQIYFADVRTYFCAGAEFDFLRQIYAIRVFHEDYWFVKPQSGSSIKFKVSRKFHGISPCHLSVKKWNTLPAYKKLPHRLFITWRENFTQRETQLTLHMHAKTHSTWSILLDLLTGVSSLRTFKVEVSFLTLYLNIYLF